MIIFPQNPAVDDVFRSWRWNGRAWVPTDVEAGGDIGDVVTSFNSETGDVTFGAQQVININRSVPGARVPIVNVTITNGNDTTTADLLYEFGPEYDLYEIEVVGVTSTHPTLSAGVMMQYGISGPTWIDSGYRWIDHNLDTRFAVPVTDLKTGEGIFFFVDTSVERSDMHAETLIRLIRPGDDGPLKMLRWESMYTYLIGPSHMAVPYVVRTIGVGHHAMLTEHLSGVRFLLDTAGGLIQNGIRTGNFTLYGITKYVTG